VTRGDLLRPYLRTDSEIRADVEETLLGDSLGLGGGRVDVRVDGGVVLLRGLVDGPRQRALSVRLARTVEGVIDVVDDLEVA